MSDKLMLIDQYHDVETRVAIIKDAFLEDFDYEIAKNKLKKGNIYAARVIRIEPSLQAAFLDFGEQQHGFLAFSEIHPNYYSADKKTALKAETQIEDASEEEDEELPKRSRPIFSYKIQEVIKKNQMMMVQVVKDGWGTKRAALTTYISLAGKYSILMPNTANSNGISRKILSQKDRENIKEIVASLSIPETMSIIVRTAGLDKKKKDIKHDYDYLMRLWTNLSKKSMKEPGLIYEEHDLVVRALRDLFTSDIEEIIIQGEEAFKKAVTFLKMAMPSNVKRVNLYNEQTLPLFEKFGIEDQIEAIYQSKVALPSGGSIVINPTEALVAIDVNSARSTQEKHIEDTAFKTNLEACSVIARHLKLRDLSGLIVIDFIDVSLHKRSVIEKTLKESLKTDRARIQVGKISSFGLLEMSRQRIRQSIWESCTTSCTKCLGAGRIISLSAIAMKCLKQLEKSAFAGESVIAYGSHEVISFLLNENRHIICDMEKKYNVSFQLKVNSEFNWSEFQIEQKSNALKEQTVSAKLVSAKPIPIKPAPAKPVAVKIAHPKPVIAAVEKKMTAEKQSMAVEEILVTAAEEQPMAVEEILVITKKDNVTTAKLSSSRRKRHYNKNKNLSNSSKIIEKEVMSEKNEDILAFPYKRPRKITLH